MIKDYGYFSFSGFYYKIVYVLIFLNLKAIFHLEFNNI